MLEDTKILFFFIVVKKINYARFGLLENFMQHFAYKLLYWKGLLASTAVKVWLPPQRLRHISKIKGIRYEPFWDGALLKNLGMIRRFTETTLFCWRINVKCKKLHLRYC